MITLPTGTRIWIIAGVTDMRCGFNGLASKVQNTLKGDPFPASLPCSTCARSFSINLLAGAGRRAVIFSLKTVPG